MNTVVSLGFYIVLFPSCLNNMCSEKMAECSPGPLILCFFILFFVFHFQGFTFRVWARAGFLNTCPHLGTRLSISSSPPSSFPASLRAATPFAQCWAATSATGNPTSASSTAPHSTSWKDSWKKAEETHAYNLTGKLAEQEVWDAVLRRIMWRLKLICNFQRERIKNTFD